jgi:hypothetical protein
MFLPSKKHPRQKNTWGWRGLFGGSLATQLMKGVDVPEYDRQIPFSGPKMEGLSLLQYLKKRLGI